MYEYVIEVKMQAHRLSNEEVGCVKSVPEPIWTQKESFGNVIIPSR